MKVKELGQLIEQFAPLDFQESYDNAGLCVGNPNMDISAALICFDVTEEIVDEAIALKANLIISHHPVIFSGLKKITGRNAVERIVLKAIQNGIALYAAHTNLDSVFGGINSKLASILNLQNQTILSPLSDRLSKVVVFVPESHVQAVREAMGKAGAGAIGDYDSCTFNTHGEGTFRAAEGAHPYVGEIGQMHVENEVRIESICEKRLVHRVIDQMLSVHPYEEPAYDIIPLENKLKSAGIGMVGDLPTEMKAAEFLQFVKSALNCNVLRYSKPNKPTIRRVAVCGGSGAGFVSEALAQQADALVTADVKYHNFIDAEQKLLMVDAGHFETEHFAVDIFYDFITKKMVNFAVYKTKHIYNPVNYLFH